MHSRRRLHSHWYLCWRWLKCLRHGTTRRHEPSRYKCSARDSPPARTRAHQRQQAHVGHDTPCGPHPSGYSSKTPPTPSAARRLTPCMAGFAITTLPESSIKTSLVQGMDLHRLRVPGRRRPKGGFRTCMRASESVGCVFVCVRVWRECGGCVLAYGCTHMRARACGPWLAVSSNFRL